MPSPMGGGGQSSRDGGGWFARCNIGLIIGAFLVINAFGLCNTYGTLHI